MIKKKVRLKVLILFKRKRNFWQKFRNIIILARNQGTIKLCGFSYRKDIFLRKRKTRKELNCLCLNMANILFKKSNILKIKFK